LACPDPAFLRRVANGVTIELRVHPRARRMALEAVAGGLKASVTAPPEDGKANKAVIDLLAREWHLPKSVFEIARGAGVRDKVLGISGEPDAIAERIATWLGQRVGNHG
jgi:uncharacterized protein (TIGR00251 family)